MRDALCASEPGVGLVIQVVVLCLVALSAWLLLRVGRISLGQQAYFGIGAYVAALLTTVGQWPLLAALLAATLAAVACALLISWPLLRLPGLQYAVATLSVAELVRLGLSGWRHQVPQAGGQMAGPDGVHGFRDIRWLFEHQVGQTEYMLWALLALDLTVVTLLLLARTRLGLAMQAVGQDELLADSQGLPVQRIRLLASALAAAVAALAGGLYAHQLTYIEPAIFDPMLGIHAVGYSMLGGLATPLGPLLGAAFDLRGVVCQTLGHDPYVGDQLAHALGRVRWRPRGVLDEALLQRLSDRWRALGLRRSPVSAVPGPSRDSTLTS